MFRESVFTIKCLHFVSFVWVLKFFTIKIHWERRLISHIYNGDSSLHIVFYTAWQTSEILTWIYILTMLTSFSLPATRLLQNIVSAHTHINTIFSGKISYGFCPGTRWNYILTVCSQPFTLHALLRRFSPKIPFYNPTLIHLRNMSNPCDMQWSDMTHWVRSSYNLVEFTIHPDRPRAIKIFYRSIYSYLC